MCESYWKYGSDYIADVTNSDDPWEACRPEEWGSPSEPKKWIRVNKNSHIYKELGEKHYNAMHRLLNAADGEVGELLKSLWEKRENDLRVFDKKANDPCCKVNPDTGELGVYINLKKGTKDNRILKAYQTIFHEFFHNIDMRVNVEDRVMYSYADRYNNDMRTYRCSDGTFAYRCKEGTLYTMLEQEVLERVGSSGRIASDRYNAFKDSMDRVRGADWSIVSYVLDILCVAAIAIDKDVNRRMLEDFCKRKLLSLDFCKEVLCAEFFANMSSAAITNSESFICMQTEFPESYKLFIKILKDMDKNTSK